jgi:branched-chain amino acid transport system ATP-binding protein
MGSLDLQDISVRFGGIAALDAVTLSIEPGIVTGLIGPNGAGKTTLFNVITGFQRADSGLVVLNGTNISKMRPYQRARLGLGRTFQRLELFGSLTVRENVLVAAESRRPHGDYVPLSQLADDCLKRLGLDDVADRKAATLPTGSARLLELARALVADPKLLLLDEPSSGLTAQESQNLTGVLSQLAGDGMGVLIVEHDMDLIMKACSTIHVLDFGKLLKSGSPSEVQTDPNVRRAYLGAATNESNIPVRTSLRRDSAEQVETVPDLRFRAIRAGYGMIEAVRDIDIDVWPGQIFALLGPNGAGKSTLLKVAGGRLAPTAGEVQVRGATVKFRSPDQAASAGICTIPEERGVFPNLSVLENLKMWRHTAHKKSSEIEEITFERFPALKPRSKQLAGSLSGGEQQMLAISRALVSDPKVLLLDEISMGLAPIIVAQLYEIVQQLSADGLSVLLVEQLAGFALSVADYGAIMTQGRVKLSGPPAELKEGLELSYLAQT